MKKVRIDGVEYEAEGEVIARLSQETVRADSLEESLSGKEQEIDQLKNDSADKYSELEAKYDAEKARADKAEADLKAHQDAAPADIEALVASRLALRASVEKAGLEYKADEAELDTKKRVILAMDESAKLDEKTEAYIEARFDIAMETLEKESEQDRKNRLDAAEVPKKETKEDSYEGMSKSEAARAKMIKGLVNPGSAE